MTMTVLNSSNLAACDYDDDTGEIEIQFKSGSTYRYKGGREYYEGLLSATSPGQYFIRNMKDRLPSVRVS